MNKRCVFQYILTALEKVEQLSMVERQWRLELFAIGRVLPGAPFGLADGQPVGGLIRGTRKTIPLDEDFEQINGVAVFGLPIAT